MAEFHHHLGRSAPDYRQVMGAVHRALKDNYITTPPVSPVEIARNYGLQVLFGDFPSRSDVIVSGFLKENTIYVNRIDPANRQTFTVAHELGHYILHKELFSKYPDEYKVLLRAPIGATKDPLEQEANAFAAQLLVPREMLEKYKRIGNIGELARLFNVSEDVVRFRLAYESKYDAA